MKLFQMFALGTVVATGLVMAQAPAAAPAAAQTAAKEAKTKARDAKMAAPAPQTAAQIADAKAKGLVWCNTTSKACHEADDKYYGTTKRGEFVAKSELAGKGYHMAGDTAKAAGGKGAAKKAAADAATAAKK